MRKYITLFRHDPFFAHTMGLPFFPAPETLRLYLEEVAGNYSYALKRIEECNIRLIKQNRLKAVTAPFCSYIPVDCDVTTMDNSKSKKEGVSRTYKGFDGFAPINAYIANEGYMLGSDLRIGKQHCQKDAPQFLIRHNLRKESPLSWLEIAKAEGTVTHKSFHKTVYTGFHTGRYPAGDESIPVMDLVFEVTERHTDKEGNPLRINDVEVEAFWTNLYEDPQSVIALYRDHATSEQFHSELKSDMGVERLPSGKFMVNALLLQVAMLGSDTSSSGKKIRGCRYSPS